MSTIGVGKKRGRRPPSSNNESDSSNSTITIPTAKRSRINIDDNSTRIILNFILHMTDAVKDGVLFHLPVKNKERFYTFINTLFSSSSLATQIGTRSNIQTILNQYYKSAGGAPWYDTYSQFIDSEITTLSDNDVFKIPICRLSYFQNKKNKILYLPTIYGPDARPEQLTKHRIRFSIQDSGKDANAFDPDITQLITPGSYLDPASRKSEGEKYITNLINTDFKEMGLGHIIESLTITGDTPVTITLRLKQLESLGWSDTETLKFQFGTNINDPRLYIRSHPNNTYLFGNATKNTYINSERADSGTVYKYILMKILGDLLQVYYGKKKIDDPTGGITRNQICAFTSDKFFALRAALFKVPCIIQDYSAMKMGSDSNLYMFYSYEADINTINKVNKYVCNEVIHDNMEITKRIFQAIQRDSISIGTVIYTPIAQPVKNYMIRITQIILDIIRVLGLLGEESEDLIELRRKYNIPSELNFNLNPGLFHPLINKYRASDILFGDNVKSIALSTNSVFKLLPRDHSTNEADGIKDRPSQGFREFVQRMQTVGTETRGNVVSSTTQRYLARMSRGGGRRFTRSKRHINRSTTKNTKKSYISVIYHTDPETAVNNAIVHALNQYSTVYKGVPIPYFVEDIVALLYPFFKLRGAYTVNNAFYMQIIRLLIAHDGELTTKEFTDIYNMIHAYVDDDIVDDGSDGPSYETVEFPSVSEEDYPLVIEENIQEDIRLFEREIANANRTRATTINSERVESTANRTSAITINSERVESTANRTSATTINSERVEGTTAKGRMMNMERVNTAVAMAPGGNFGGGRRRFRKTRRRKGSKHE